MLLNLNDGIQNISDTISLLRNKNDFAYFFIVGAGISVPEIPTASKIIEICKNEVKKRGVDVYHNVTEKSELLKKNPSEYYSSWIENAFPNPINRSQFYKSLIKESKISSANLMLAQILQSKTVSNTVFTTNFDDKIEQALDIIGSKDVFSSENNMDNLVVNVSSDEIQIVHVHGTYRFYDIANLDIEISNVSGQTGTISSFQVLRNFLQQKAPIIFGYSGWENDVIMKCLKERLSYPVPYNYIWVCYSKKDYDILPNWLKDNNNVCFLIPSDNSAICDDTEKDIENIFNQTQENGVSEIPSTLFLGKIISQLKIAPPKIFVNPYEYFSNMVKKTLPHNEDVLHLRHWAERMKYFAQEDTEFEIKVKELEVALISKDFDSISQVILSLSKINLTEGDIKFLVNIILSELLEDKYLIKIANSKAKLVFAILDFADSHYELLLKGNELNDLLHNILLVRFKKSEKSENEKVIDIIYKLTKDREKLLNTHLSSIGFKSSITHNDDEKILLLNELLDKVPNETKVKALKHKQIVALLNKCELVDGNEAITLYTDAKKIVEEFEFEGLGLLLLKTKSEITLKIKDGQEQIKWATECIDEVADSDSQECKYEVLKVINSLAHISPEYLFKIDNFEERINTILNRILHCKCEVENCECTFMVAETFHLLIEITHSDKNKMAYCQQIISLESKFPHKCGRYKITLFVALSEMCKLPTMFVPDEIKIGYLEKMKNMETGLKYQHRIFVLSLEAASELGNKKSYVESELKEDFLYIELYSMEKKAMDEYLNKSYVKAEELYQKLSESTYNILSDTAFNNLAFMARRCELSEKSLPFKELIEKVSDKNIFKHMNLLLYYLEVDNNDLDKCKEEFNVIKHASEGDIELLINCWRDKDLVGEESEIAMIIISNIILKTQELNLDFSLNSKYNLDILKTIICS